MHLLQVLLLACAACQALAFAPAAALASSRSAFSARSSQTTMVAVTFNDKKTVNVEAGSSLMAAASKAGFMSGADRIRFDCKEGKCGMCQVKVNGKSMRTCIAKVPKADCKVIVP
jgi:ferredoxin